MRIGIFDSGIGGLTVLKEMVKNYKEHEYIYVGDTLNVPYGNKSKEQLLALSSKIIDYLITRDVDKIIIACGTVSSNLSNEFKKIYSVPIIDIISPTINYLKVNNYNKVGVIATSMTIKSRVFSKNLKDIEVIEVECPKLVPFIESNSKDEINSCLNEYLKEFKANKIDILILGCTHYPIVKDNIKNILNYDVKILNMADPIVSLLSKNESKSSLEINFSKIDSNVIDNVKLILGNDIEYDIKEINL